MKEKKYSQRLLLKYIQDNRDSLGKNVMRVYEVLKVLWENVEVSWDELREEFERVYFAVEGLNGMLTLDKLIEFGIKRIKTDICPSENHECPSCNKFIHHLS